MRPVGAGIAVFGGLGWALVEVGVVGFAAAGHRHVKRCAGGVFAQHDVAGVSGHALGGVHRDGVPVGDVLAHVVAVEGRAGPVTEPASRDAVAVGVDGGHPPTVSIAHRIGDRQVALGFVDAHGGIVAPADDQIPHGDALSASRGDGGRISVDRSVVDAPVERVAHLGGVTHQQRIPARGDIGGVGGDGVVGHRDRIAGVQPAMGAVPLDRAAPRWRPASSTSGSDPRSSG